MFECDEHTFLVIEKTLDTPPEIIEQKINGREKEDLIREWTYNLLEQWQWYIPELQSMGYDLATKKDLLEWARKEVEYYRINPWTIYVH